MVDWGVTPSEIELICAMTNYDTTRLKNYLSQILLGTIPIFIFDHYNKLLTGDKNLDAKF